MKWTGGNCESLQQIIVYDVNQNTARQIEHMDFWNHIPDMVYCGCKSAEEIEQALLTKQADVVLVADHYRTAAQIPLVQDITRHYPSVPVIIISSRTGYEEVRQAFLMGVSDYLEYPLKEEVLLECLQRLSHAERDIYITAELYSKIDVLAKHIFDGGTEAVKIAMDILNQIFSDWCNDELSCQLVIERAKEECYKMFVRRKPWLEKFVYRGNYIYEIGFSIKPRELVEKEWCSYFSDVAALFQKYNVIDINPTIYRIGKYVILHVDEKLTLERVANAVYLNKSYISYIFKEMTGISFADYVLEVKTDRAKTLLRDKNTRISDISSLLGYSNPGYFSKIFRQKAGMSPTEYRKEEIL